MPNGDLGFILQSIAIRIRRREGKHNSNSVCRNRWNRLAANNPLWISSRQHRVELDPASSSIRRQLGPVQQGILANRQAITEYANTESAGYKLTN